MTSYIFSTIETDPVIMIKHSLDIFIPSNYICQNSHISSISRWISYQRTQAKFDKRIFAFQTCECTRAFCEPRAQLQQYFALSIFHR